MLIYNFQKEFLGMDEKGLKSFGYDSLASLKSEVDDFADLFVKTPGHIHNFQHVHWIDFIECAEDNEIQRVIINANSKNYGANLTLSYAYLSDNPSEKAYLVELRNIKSLTDAELVAIQEDISHHTEQKPLPSYEPTPEKKVTPKEETIAPVNTLKEEAPLETPKEETPKEENLDFKLDIDLDFEESASKPVVQEPQKESEQKPLDTPLDITLDTPLDIVLDETPVEIPVETSVQPPVESQLETPKVEKRVIQKEVEFENGYIYDPDVAAQALGLPLDLIEEFLQDFIAQAKEFKEMLYAALEDEDIENIKSLSHKLKGVAANLRIEDALEVLTTINTTSDMHIVSENLDLLYKIVAKLAGEKIIVEETQEIVLPQETPQKEGTLPTPEESPKEESISIDLEEPFIESPSIKSDDKIEIEPPIEIALDSDIMMVPEEEKKEDLAVEEPTIKLEEATMELEEPKTELAEPTIELEESSPKIEINYSKTKVATEIGLDLESFNELFEDYITEAGTIIDSLHKSVESDDFESLQSEATKLKGMSDNMRVNSFNSELSALMHETDKKESLKHVDNIHHILETLSKVGV